jgi:hypothetical protein
MTQAVDIRSSASLIQDYLQVEMPPTTGNLVNGFAAIQELTPGGQPATELLALSNDNTAVLDFVRDGASPSGWRLAPSNISARGGTFEALLPFLARGLNALLPVTPPQGQSFVSWWWRRPGQQAWIPFAERKNLYVWAVWQYVREVPSRYIDPSGNLFLYGTAPTSTSPSTFYWCVLPSTTGGEDYWKDWGAAMPLMPASPDYLLLDNAGDADNPYRLLWADGITISYDHFHLIGLAPQFSGERRSFSLPSAAGTITRFIAIPGATGSFLVRTAREGGISDGLYAVSDYDQPTPVISPLTGEENQPQRTLQVTLGVDSRGLCTVFALDGDAKLWVLRATESGPQSEPRFGGWAPLGDTLLGMTCPASLQLGPELFAIDQQTRLLHLAQNPSDGTWTTQVIATASDPTTAPQEMSLFTWDIDTLDATGAAVAGAQVSLNADRPTTIIVDNLSYYTDPDTPVITSSNSLGKLVVATPATGLAAPLLSVTLGGQNPVSCPGDLAMFNRLAGNDLGFAVTPEGLQQAGLMSASVQDAATVVTAIRSAGQAMQALRSGLPASAPLGAGGAYFGLAFGDSTRREVRPLTAAELADLRARAAVATELPSWLSHIWGDVTHYFSQAAHELKSLTLEIADRIAATIEDVHGNVRRFILTTVDQLADWAQLVFQQIEKAVEDVIAIIKKVIAWLEMLLDWQNILYTQQVVAYYFGEVLKNIDGDLEAVSSRLNGWFASFNADIADAFQAAITQFANQSFNGVPGSAAGTTGSSTLVPSQLQDAYDGNTALCNYVLNKVLAAPPAFGSIAAAQPDGSISLQTILAQIEQQAGELFDRLAHLRTYLTELKNPSTFLDGLVASFLSMTEDGVLFVAGVLEDIVADLIALASKAIAALQSLLTSEIDLPVVSWLFKKLTGRTLTGLDLCMLLIAVPATILFEVIEGHPPFASQADVDKITNVPIPWPSLSALTVDETAPVQAISDETIYLLNTLAGAVDFYYTFVDTWNNANSMVDDPESNAKLILGSSITAVAFTFVSGGLGAPIAAIVEPRQAGSGYAMAQWGVAWTMPVADLISTAFDKKLIRYLGNDDGGRWLMTFVGLLNVGMGIYASVEEAGTPAGDGWVYTCNVVPPLADVIAFLPTIEDPVATAIWYGLTVVLDLASGGCTIGSADYSLRQSQSSSAAVAAGAGTIVSFTAEGGAGYVRIAPSATLVPDKGLSLAALIYLDPAQMQSPASTNMKLIATQGFTLGIGTGDFSGANSYRTVYPEFQDRKGHRYDLQVGEIPFGQWVLVQASWNEAGLVQAFINGTLVGWRPTTERAPLDASSHAPLYLAVYADGQSFPYIGLLASASVTDISTASVLGAWTLDGGSGSTVPDGSGHGNTGTLGGEAWSWAFCVPAPSA